MTTASVFEGARRIVVKGLQLCDQRGPRRGCRCHIGNWCRQLAALAQDGYEVVMVSSGAIAEGMKRLGPRAPKELHELPGGGCGRPDGIGADVRNAAQRPWPVQRASAADARRLQPIASAIHARSTPLTLLAHRVLPVINENDTVVTDEIKFGDNDTLGAPCGQPR